MKKLIDVVKNPSRVDSLSNYCGEIPDSKFYVLMTRTRDSDVLTESNWECALESLGGESEGQVEIFRFGHWACGWWEALCVVEGSKAFDIAADIESRLEDYPVLDENHFSEAESNEANEVWTNCYNDRDRLGYIREHRDQFYFSSMTDLMAVVRGRYFIGYASELIS